MSVSTRNSSTMAQPDFISEGGWEKTVLLAFWLNFPRRDGPGPESTPLGILCRLQLIMVYRNRTIHYYIVTYYKW